jgi:polygalacturonase
VEVEGLNNVKNKSGFFENAMKTQLHNCCSFRAFFLPVAMGLLFEVNPALALPALPVINTNNVVNITSFGAVSSTTLTNTTAIQNAINAAAAGGTTNGAAGGTVEIPPGIYLSGPLTLASSVNLQIDAGAILRMLPLGMYPGGTTSGTTFISGSNLHDIEISGSGAIDGQGAAWWPYSNTNGANRPRMISPSDCNRLLIQNVTLSNSPMFHIAISGSSSGNSTVQGVTIFAPGSSPNTDACDVDGTNILVQNCNISEGDDDFTCGGGTSGVLLTNNTYGTGHGISIGSYTDSGGVSNITVINCTMNGTVNGIRIKSDNDRGGLVQNISYSNIGMTNVDFPIQIYSYYDEVGTPSSVSPYYAATQAVAAVTSLTPIYRNIAFSNITATSVSGYPIGIIWARTEMPATNIVFNKVNITGNRNFCLYNVSGAQFIDCNLNPSATSNTFAMFNAQIIVTNSAPTNTLFTFAGLTTNGYGNGFTFYNAQASTKTTNAFGAGPLTLAASTFIVSNSLTLFPATTLNYVLGTNTAKLAVVGNLALGGTVTVTNGSGFTNGAYTLMTYTGILSGSPPALGSVPAGYNYAFDTSTVGQVNLDVSTTAFTVPAAPTNVVATAGNQLVTLTWSPSATATNYNVKRSTTSGGPYPTTNSVTTTSYSDTQVTNGATYYYVVSAVNAVGEGTNSAEVSATPQASQSTGWTVNVFSDVFSASTVNSSSPSSPTATATSYEVLSSKPWNPTPGISAGHFQFGIGTTTSGCIEVQALFTNSPVALMNNGDTLSLTVTFTNTSGLLTQSSAMGFGLYHSGQNFPVPGGLNGTATSSLTGNATGNAQTWMGYVGQLAFTGSSSQILTRSSQTGTANNNQDLVTTGSSASYSYPAGSTVGTASSVALVAGNPYTELLTLTLTATNTLAITNLLYSGTNTNGTLLSQFGAAASGGTYLTNTFDALAVGWRATANTFATAIDINQIAVNVTLAPTGPPVSLIPTNIVCQVVGGQLQLSWPQDHLGWRLQIQTNDLSSGLGTNWTDVPDANLTNQVFIPIDANNGSVFLQLTYP